MNSVEIATKALEWLRNNGWAQGAGIYRNPRRDCMVSALSQVVHQGTWARHQKLHAAYNVLAQVCREQYPDRVGTRRSDAISVNDHPDTTFEDIERIYEKAIVRLQEMEV